MIAFLSVFPPFRGGIAKFSHQLYMELESRDEVYAVNFRKLYPEMLYPGKSQITRFTGERYAVPALHSFNPYNWKKTAGHIINHEPETLIFSYWHPFFIPSLSRVIQLVKKELPDIMTVGIYHSAIRREWFPFQRYLLKKLVALTDLPITLSNHSTKKLTDMATGQPPLALFHPVYEQPLPESNRINLRQQLGFKDDEIIVLFFGLIRNYKGLDLFIEALNGINLKKHKIRPVIVGEFYISKNSVLKNIHPMHLRQYVIIDRFVSEEEAATYLFSSDVMILPYRTAGQSGVLSNAINFHLPVIVSDVPGLTEYITSGTTGLVFESGNSKALRTRIIEFISEDYNASFSKNMQYLKEKLTWGVFADRLLEEIKNRKR